MGKENETNNKKRKNDVQSSVSKEATVKISETWAQETIEDLDDFIESQGIYIRQ